MVMDRFFFSFVTQLFELYIKYYFYLSADNLLRFLFNFAGNRIRNHLTWSFIRDMQFWKVYKIGFIKAS